MAVQQGRSERRPEAYPLGYVEDLSEARTMLADVFSILLNRRPTVEKGGKICDRDEPSERSGR
jgi:hypothetical protein